MEKGDLSSLAAWLSSAIDKAYFACDFNSFHRFVKMELVLHRAMLRAIK